MAHAAINMNDNRVTLALRIPRVGLKANFHWNGVTLCVAVKVRGVIHCLHIGTVSRRESEICELVITFTTKAEEIIDAVNRNQFPNLISGVEVLRERGVLHQTLTEVETVLCSTGRPATVKKEDPNPMLFFFATFGISSLIESVLPEVFFVLLVFLVSESVEFFLLEDVEEVEDFFFLWLLVEGTQ